MTEKIAAYSETDEELKDFWDYLEIVARRKKNILKVALITALLSTVLVLLMPKVFSATALILPPQQDQGLAALMLGQLGGGLGSLAGSVLGAATPADQYASILESDRMSDVIIDRFKLMEEYNKDNRVDMYKKLDKVTDFKAGKKDGIITITVEDEDPKKAAAIANAYVEELGKLNAELSMTSAGQSRQFLEGRLAKAKADLARAEDAMKAFQSKNSAISVSDQAKASIEGVALLKSQIAAQEAQLSAMRSQFTDTTPEVKAIRASLANLRSQLAALEGTGTGAIPSVGSVPRLGEEQIRLMREFKTQEMIVELLTKQNELAKMTEAKDTNTIQVIQKATVPDKKVKPKRALIVIAFTFLSIAASASWAILKDHLESLPEEEAARYQRVKAALSWRSGN